MSLRWGSRSTHHSDRLIKQLLNYGCIISCCHIISLSVCLHRRVQFNVLIFSKSFCLMTFYQCYYDFINISISAVNDHISLRSFLCNQSSVQHIQASINEQFNLEQKKDLFSPGFFGYSITAAVNGKAPSAAFMGQFVWGWDDITLYVLHFSHFFPFSCFWHRWFSFFFFSFVLFFSPNVLSYRWITHFSQHFPPSFTSRLEFYYYRNISQGRSCSESRNTVSGSVRKSQLGRREVADF